MRFTVNLFLFLFTDTVDTISPLSPDAIRSHTYFSNLICANLSARNIFRAVRRSLFAYSAYFFPAVLNGFNFLFCFSAFFASPIYWISCFHFVIFDYSSGIARAKTQLTKINDKLSFSCDVRAQRAFRLICKQKTEYHQPLRDRKVKIKLVQIEYANKLYCFVAIGYWMMCVRRTPSKHVSSFHCELTNISIWIRIFTKIASAIVWNIMEMHSDLAWCSLCKYTTATATTTTTTTTTAATETYKQILWLLWVNNPKRASRIVFSRHVCVCAYFAATAENGSRRRQLVRIAHVRTNRTHIYRISQSLVCPVWCVRNLHDEKKAQWW